MSNPSARLTVIDYEPIPGITPEQKLLATRRIAERARDVDDARLLLAIVFETPHLSTPHGNKTPPAVYADRRAWLGRCRAWMREQGRGPGGMQLSKTDQRDYQAATGDIWGPDGEAK